MKFTLYPIHWLADAVDDEQFDHDKLPFDITEGVRIEAVSVRFRNGTFDHDPSRRGHSKSDGANSISPRS